MYFFRFFRSFADLHVGPHPMLCAAHERRDFALMAMEDEEIVSDDEEENLIMVSENKGPAPKHDVASNPVADDEEENGEDGEDGH